MLSEKFVDQTCRPTVAVRGHCVHALMGTVLRTANGGMGKMQTADLHTVKWVVKCGLSMRNSPHFTHKEETQPLLG